MCILGTLIYDVESFIESAIPIDIDFILFKIIIGSKNSMKFIRIHIIRICVRSIKHLCFIVSFFFQHKSEHCLNYESCGPSKERWHIKVCHSNWHTWNFVEKTKKNLKCWKNKSGWKIQVSNIERVVKKCLTLFGVLSYLSRNGIRYRWWIFTVRESLRSLRSLGKWFCNSRYSMNEVSLAKIVFKLWIRFEITGWPVNLKLKILWIFKVFQLKTSFFSLTIEKELWDSKE